MTGAFYGQLAGAFCGVNGVPEAWREQIARREEIVRLATVLHEDAAGP
jgi:ADP-ribosyl-[dinitrogen reductase] hydrolase